MFKQESEIDDQPEMPEPSEGGEIQEAIDEALTESESMLAEAGREAETGCVSRARQMAREVLSIAGRIKTAARALAKVSITDAESLLGQLDEIESEAREILAETVPEEESPEKGQATAQPSDIAEAGSEGSKEGESGDAEPS